MPQFDTAFFVGQIFWLLLSFGFLYALMSLLICPMISDTLAAREAVIRRYLDQADRLNRRAETLHQRHQTALLAADAEKNDRIRDAFTAIQAEARRTRQAEIRRLRQKVRRAEQRIEARTTTLQSESDTLSDKLAEQLTTRFVGGTTP